MMETGTMRLEERSRDGIPCLAVTGTRDGVRDLAIPFAVEDIPVREIGAHAFAGNEQLRFVSVPESVDTVGAFAFHNCKALARMELHDSVTRYGDGAIRQCTALSDVYLVMHENNHEVITRMLSDCDNTLTVTVSYPDGEARLTFPGFVYDFTENTMARTIQFNIEGSGMAFRDCVSRSGIDFAAYDRLFSRAKLDNISVITQVILNRLEYPYALGEQAREGYETYLRENAKPVLETLVRNNDPGRLRFLAEERTRHLAGKDALDAAILLASGKGMVETAAILTDWASHAAPTSHHGMLIL